MYKLGTFLDKRTNNTYVVMNILNKPDYERIDIISPDIEYQVFDTSLTKASYYRKNREYILGEEKLVKSYLKTRTEARILTNSTPTKDLKVIDGKIIMELKNVSDNGNGNTTIQTNGKITREIFETAEYIIDLDDIVYDGDFNVAPLNSRDYKALDVLCDSTAISADRASDFHSLDYLKNKFPLAHIEENDFCVVASEQEADERLYRFVKSLSKVKAIDTETTGFKVVYDGEDFITGIVLSHAENESTYYPFRQTKFKYNLPIEYMKKIVDAVNNQPVETIIVAHNGKFEIKAFLKDGYNIRIDACSFVLSFLLNPTYKVKGLHVLKNLAEEVDGNFYLELSDIFIGRVAFDILTEDIVRYYACPDAPNTIKVFKHLMKKLPKDRYKAYAIENKLIYSKALNEFYGMRVDMDALQRAIDNEEYKVKLLGDKFRSMHKTDKNINSTVVRREILYNRLRCPVEVRTITDLPSTSSTAITRIVNSGKLPKDDSVVIEPILDKNAKVIVESKDLHNKFPSIVILAAYLKARKELSALRRIEKKLIGDIVQFGINQVGASSGRQTSDAHQYSDTMKTVIVADTEEHLLWSVDYKQVELRVLAYLAGQLDLIELQKDPDVDIHRAILAVINSLDMWEISAEMRKKGKAVNFGVVYMMSEYGLAHNRYGAVITDEQVLEALKDISAFMNGLPLVKKFLLENEEFIRENGYIKTKFGTVRHLTDILDPEVEDKRKKSLIRAGNNTPVQGFAAYLLKIAENNYYQYIKDKGWDQLVTVGRKTVPLVRVMLSIHDEVLISSHKSIPKEEIIIMCKECMEIDIEGSAPYFAAPALVSRWSDGKNDSYEIPISLRDEVIKAWKEDKRELFSLENYHKDLLKYREDKLAGYMNPLVAKYKTPAEVAKHVKHPDLTHVLISTFTDKSDKVSHLEAIALSVERYMAKLEGKEIEVHEVVSDNDDVKYIDVEEFYAEIDATGDTGEDTAEFEEEVDVEIDETANILIMKDFIERQQQASEYTIYALNECIVDFTDIGIKEEGNEVFKQIVSHSNPQEHYQLVIMIGTIMKPTNIKVGHIPNIINKYMRDALNKRVDSDVG